MEPTKVNLVKSPGMLALGAFLVITGLNMLIGIPYVSYLSGILAIAAGVLILMGK